MKTTMIMISLLAISLTANAFEKLKPYAVVCWKNQQTLVLNTDNGGLLTGPFFSESIGLPNRGTSSDITEAVRTVTDENVTTLIYHIKGKGFVENDKEGDEPSKSLDFTIKFSRWKKAELRNGSGSKIELDGCEEIEDRSWDKRGPFKLIFND
jgi:hypothetical protein